jgi:hypothetical protein
MNKLSMVAHSASPTLNPTVLPSRNPCELQALQFFQDYTVSQLSGYFESDIWNRYVLQLSLVEPSLYYATIALAGLHRWYATGNSPGSIDTKTFALQQYNKAIYYLRQPAKPLPLHVVLVTCYIFSGFEALYGNYASAFRHVASGISLISKKIRINPQTYSTGISGLRSSLEEKQIEDKLLYHFSRLDLLAATFDSAWTPRTIDQDSLRNLPSSLSSLEQARALLNVLLLRIMEFKRSEASGNDPGVKSAAMISINREKLQQDLIQFSNALECWFAQTSGSLDDRQICGSRLLKVHSLAGNIMLSVPEGDKETAFDLLLPLFQGIVLEVSHLVSCPPTSRPDMGLQRYFSNEPGIIPALYLTGTKCRDPTIRRKAQDLLASFQRREGVWDSLQAAKVVECVITVEEGDTVVASCGDISESARVFDMVIQIPSDEDRYAFVVFSRGQGDGEKLEMIEERISW